MEKIYIYTGVCPPAPAPLSYMHQREGTMEPDYQEFVQEYIRACRKGSELGLFRFNSGNLSLRVGENRLIIKTMGSSMGALAPEEVALCSIAGGEPLDGKTPSKEIGFHAGIMRVRGDAGSVFHFQSTYATAVSCMKETVQSFDIIPEIPHYIGSPAYVEYHLPGSHELALAVVDAARAHDMVILRNHGLVTVGKDLHDVLLKAGYFEMACEILIHVKNLSIIPKREAALLRRR